LRTAPGALSTAIAESGGKAMPLLSAAVMFSGARTLVRSHVQSLTCLRIGANRYPDIAAD
ncbi:MAG: hypothetical protein ACREIC_03960, partial [Limisphaerales bacterium]